MTERRIRGGRPVRDADGFVPKEKAFALHYVGAANRNATEAALMAGYSPGNRNGARTYGSQLLRTPHIIAFIQRLDDERCEKLNVTAEDVLRDLLRLKVDVEALGVKSAPAARTRLDVIKAVGEHVAVGAFRRQLGLSGPGGGPIETIDAALLAGMNDEELDAIERARAILDRRRGVSAGDQDSERVGDPGGAGAAPQAT